MMQRNECLTGKVSVIMGIYNCADTLPEALDSILAQTYDNWELIMCDDGSNDTTREVAEDYRRKYPEKIKLLVNNENKGLNQTLNRCLEIAEGDYIARMDGDDICSPDRLERELAVLRERPDISIVSTDMLHFDQSGVWGRSSHPAEPKSRDFVHGTPFCHASCMVRKEAYEAVGGYSVGKKLLRVEDYHLWVKMYAKGFKGFNIHEALYQMRDDRKAFKRREFRFRLNEAYVIILAVNRLKLPLWMLLFSLVPVSKGLLPEKIYIFLHKKKLR